MNGPLGFKVYRGGWVHPAADERAAAAELLAARSKGQECRVVACTTLTRDRELSADEGTRIVGLAVEMAS